MSISVSLSIRMQVLSGWNVGRVGGHICVREAIYVVLPAGLFTDIFYHFHQLARFLFGTRSNHTAYHARS
ncbi:hypothetical protein OESDEN_07389 [Oesophagostomum dentatum]|uniref:Uncharacterized protein n=1 Tax=Oesophagostomum dentatum TaxID=61180 RepID=A0A0B1T590_OESDE|nr:hypothetical protein OESDEN_07389 [Oesophagostomum dentatum]